jgi:hypothetical protein
MGLRGEITAGQQSDYLLCLGSWKTLYGVGQSPGDLCRQQFEGLGECRLRQNEALKREVNVGERVL